MQSPKPIPMPRPPLRCELLGHVDSPNLHSISQVVAPMQGRPPIYLWIAIFCFILSRALPSSGHPVCLNNDPPRIAAPSLRVCSGFNGYPGSCCTANEEATQVSTLLDRILPQRTPAALACRSKLAVLLCATCSPLSGHIFGSEMGSNLNFPLLCPPFCQRFFNACAAVTFVTNGSSLASHIPGLDKMATAPKIIDNYDNADAFCAKFQSLDAGSCLNDKIGESIGPPPIGGIVVKMTVPWPRIPFGSLPIRDPLNSRHHIVDLKFSPGNPRKVIVSYQTGEIIAFDDDPAADRYELFLNVSSKIHYVENGEMGLMGIALDPQFMENSYVYVKYTFLDRTLPFPSTFQYGFKLSRFKMSTDPSKFSLDPQSERVVLRVVGLAHMHHSGPPIFSDDGLMFIPVGSGLDFQNEYVEAHPSRNLSDFRGKILRLDVRRSAAATATDTSSSNLSRLYDVPADNPFVGRTNALPEIWSYGHRNPFRLSWDSQRKELWSTDVGYRRFEEVNLVRPGSDCGWNKKEGNECYFPGLGPCEMNTTAYQPPVYVHPHPDYCFLFNQSARECASANALIAGAWYNGQRAPSLTGKFIYTDWSSGVLFALTIEDRQNPFAKPANVTRLVPDFPAGSFSGAFKAVAFAADSSHELYVANWAEPQIFLIEDADQTRPQTLSNNGSYGRLGGVELNPFTEFTGGRVVNVVEESPMRPS